MNYAEFRRLRKRRPIRECQPEYTKQQDRLLHAIHLKTIENRTLMTTIKENLPPSKVDEIIVDYAIRLRKARRNFDSNNISKELNIIEYEAGLEERDSQIKVTTIER